jgi:hypothetical protein
VTVGPYPEGVALSPNFAAAGLLCQGNHARKRTGLGSHLATESQAAAAVNTPCPAAHPGAAYSSTRQIQPFLQRTGRGDSVIGL